MSEIILNEIDYAEKAIKNLDLGSKPVETLSRVARYYRYTYHANNQQINDMLEDFMIKCDPSINLVKWQPTIESVVKSSRKYGLIHIDGISVTKNEIDTIKNLESVVAQRLMFTMLCLAKYGNAINPSNNNWVNRKDKEIFSLANIATSSKKQSLIINDLWTLGYVGYSQVVDNINLNVKIIDNESPEILKITDFRNLGLQYMRYCGTKCIECESCGKIIKAKTNNQKYCPECAIDVDRQKSLMRWYGEMLS